MSAVVYTRVSEQLKQALAAHARADGRSLNQTVCALIDRGLTASESERAAEQLEHELAACARQLVRTRAQLAEAEHRLQAAREREQTVARLQRALAQRARHELAVCPQCRKPLRGSDFLVSGHCPNCTRAITSLLTPRPQVGAPDRDEYLALLGALGGLLALALPGNSGQAD